MILLAVTMLLGAIGVGGGLYDLLSVLATSAALIRLGAVSVGP